MNTEHEKEAHLPQKNYSIASEFTILSPIPTKWKDSHSIDTTYYTKMTVAWGIPIVSNDLVDDLILQNAAKLLSKQLGNESLFNSDMAIKIRDKLWQRHLKVAIYPTIGVSDRNFDFLGLEDKFDVGNSFSHEITHSIHFQAIRDLIPGFEQQLSDAYEASILNGTWPENAYINNNSLEYLAEGAEIWFGLVWFGLVWLAYHIRD